MTRSTALLIAVISMAILACDRATPVSVERAPASAPASAPPARQDTHAEDNAPRIAVADAKKDFDAKSAVFIDTHSPEQFAAEHIAGAINIPANQLNAYFDKIPKGKKLIIYCS
jgi:hypothetical protein